jgi:hypothetical protein
VHILNTALVTKVCATLKTEDIVHSNKVRAILRPTNLCVYNMCYRLVSHYYKPECLCLGIRKTRLDVKGQCTYFVLDSLLI